MDEPEGHMSDLENTLYQQILWAKLPEPKREFLAVKGRRFRWDFAWPDQGLLLEVQGGIWTKGGHTSGTGVTRDCAKASLAALAGFRCLYVTGGHISSGLALKWIQEALGVAA